MYRLALYPLCSFFLILACPGQAQGVNNLQNSYGWSPGRAPFGKQVI